MRTMMNPEAFYSIHKNNTSFTKIESNIEMRFFIESYGFKGQREVAKKLLEMRG